EQAIGLRPEQARQDCEHHELERLVAPDLDRRPEGPACRAPLQIHAHTVGRTRARLPARRPRGNRCGGTGASARTLSAASRGRRQRVWVAEQGFAAMTDWRPRLLVAEDDPDIRDIITATLARDGAREIRAVDNGPAALAAV